MIKKFLNLRFNPEKLFKRFVHQIEKRIRQDVGANLPADSIFLSVSYKINLESPQGLFSFEFFNLFLKFEDFSVFFIQCSFEKINAHFKLKNVSDRMQQPIFGLIRFFSYIDGTTVRLQGRKSSRKSCFLILKFIIV